MTNQELFKEAIADAKSVRDAAVANAKAALEETFTPKIMSMLSAKLNEMEEDMEEEGKKTEEGYSMEEESMETTEGSGQKSYSSEEGAKSMEEMDLEEILAELEKEEEGKMEEAKKTEEKGKKKVEEGTDVDADDKMEEAKDEEAEGDDEVTELTVDELKDIIRDVLKDVMGGTEEAEEAEEESSEEGDEESIDLDELLAELEKEEEGKEKVKEADLKNEVSTDEIPFSPKVKAFIDKAIKDAKENGEFEYLIDVEYFDNDLIDFIIDEFDDNNEYNDVSQEVKDYISKAISGKKVNNESKKSKEAEKEANKAKKDLEEAIKVIKFLKKELNEVNLLNAKNTYVNKIFKSRNLSESQKVNVLKSMDRATNVKEAKNIYETLTETLTVKKSSIRESIGFASKAMGVAPKQPIIESDAAVRRMQQLAGIIK